MHGRIIIRATLQSAVKTDRKKATAGLTVVDSDISFTIRFCKQAAKVTADGFRILFGGEIYNIVAVDHMNYSREALKFRCKRMRR